MLPTTTNINSNGKMYSTMTPIVKFGGLRRSLVILSLSIVGLAAWTIHHVISAEHLIKRKTTYPFTVVFILVFGFLAVQLILAWFDKPYKVTARQQRQLDELKVTVNVPVYNESAAILDRVIHSIINQTRKADRICIVDDGSTEDYSEIKAKYSGQIEWVRQENKGKREAQFNTFHNDQNDIWITMDSDTELDSKAIEEGLKPFAHSDITSVAGLVLATNKNNGLLVRTIDLVITTWQLTSRSALSVLGNVLVNSGPYALYRASALRKYEEAYLHETFFGKKVHYSDDSLLTMFARLEGKTVQQTSAVAFTTWPEGWSHHIRQQLRWCRGMFIRAVWRFKYLPLNSISLWFEVFCWVQFVVTSFIFIDIVAVWPIEHHNAKLVLPTLLVSPLLTYGVTLRTLLIKRSDETFPQQIFTWLLSPLIIVWGWVIFRPLRVWGMLTCLNTGWGTRSSVEIA